MKTIFLTQVNIQLAQWIKQGGVLLYYGKRR